MAVTQPFQYAGSELAIFEKAVHWKRYWRAQMAPFVKGDVLEIGAGMGANTRVLATLPHDTYTSLEPDAELAGKIPSMGPKHRTVVGTLQDLSERFDTILYLDVLEHIEDDRAEMARAARHLKPAGYAVVLAPAHAWLYGPFDQAIGHFRRYSRESLASVGQQKELTPVKLIYLDSCGLLASVTHRWLRQSTPSAWQILAWDRALVPLSRLLDPILRYSVGKSILGVWKREN